MSRPYRLALLLAALTPLVAKAQKDVASCKPVLDASAKQFTTSYHAYGSTTESQAGSKPQLAESISAGGVNYVQVLGQWHKSPLTPAAAAQMQQENVRTAKAYSCKRLREESVDGVAAVVYSAHIENEDVTGDSQIWVAKSTGLVIRTDSNIDTSHITQRFEYTDVHPPAGVQRSRFGREPHSAHTARLPPRFAANLASLCCAHRISASRSGSATTQTRRRDLHSSLVGAGRDRPRRMRRTR